MKTGTRAAGMPIAGQRNNGGARADGKRAACRRAGQGNRMELDAHNGAGIGRYATR
jgi:hypothetical protein